MTDVEQQMARVPHPFVNGARLAQMNGQMVAIVGKVDRIENGSFSLKTTDGKSERSAKKPLITDRYLDLSFFVKL